MHATLGLRYDRTVKSGLTVMELLVVLAILAALTTVAIAELSAWSDRVRLRAHADWVTAILRQVQAEAIKRQTSLTLTVRTQGSPQCLGVHAGAACDCQQPGHCVLDGQEYVWRLPDHPRFSLIAGVQADAFVFSGRRGTVTAGHLTLALPSGHAVRVVVHGAGRIRQCIPRDSPPHGALPPC